MSRQGVRIDDGTIVVPITDTLDLHSFRPEEIRDIVVEYLSAAQREGFQQVRVIHGRGIGAQRRSIRQLLASHPRVSGFEDASPAGGGWGATVVTLR
jgi:dsDNA-specific endonuclease/ATPase MutS2